MSAENQLKKQAKDILAKDNWVKSITGFLLVLTAFGIMFVFASIGSVFVEEGMEKNTLNIALCGVFSLIGVAVLILLSPVYTGYIRFISECRDSNTGDIQNIFYYFAKGRYIDTVQINLLLLVKKGMWLVVCFLPAVAMIACAESIPQYKVVFQICAVWLGIGAVVAYFLISRRYIMTQYLYVADMKYKKENDLIKASIYMVKKNYSRVISLYLSYIIWGLFCFFVLPVVFVYPYFKHSAILSYSYIYDMEKSNLQSPYNPIAVNFGINQQPVSEKQFYNNYSNSDMNNNINSANFTDGQKNESNNNYAGNSFQHNINTDVNNSSSDNENQIDYSNTPVNSTDINNI